MKFYITTLMILSILSCKNKENKIEKNEPEKKYLGYENIPNKETKYDTLFTKNITDNQKIITQLENKLIKSNFKLEKSDNIKQNSYNNCEENIVVLVKGNGIRNYYARSKVPEKHTSMKNVFPDFIITVYEFENNNIADKNFKTIERALFSAGHFCNGKAPEKLVQNGNEIYHLSTRAEMFRPYIQKYGELIKKFR